MSSLRPRSSSSRPPRAGLAAWQQTRKGRRLLQVGLRVALLAGATDIALAQAPAAAETLRPAPSAAASPAVSAATLPALAREASAASAATAATAPAEWAAGPMVSAFFEACVSHAGAMQPAVDWAVNQGWMLQDAEQPGARVLLEDGTGQVFSPPGHEGRVLLAVADRGHCLIWSERTRGPALRLQLQQALGERVAGTARPPGAAASAVSVSGGASAGRLQVQLDRKVERGQIWRQQTQWIYRPAGLPATQIGLLNTMTDQPAPQVLRLRLADEGPAYAPDGTPRR